MLPNFITHSNSTINLIMKILWCDRLNQFLKRIPPTSVLLDNLFSDNAETGKSKRRFSIKGVTL
ncbi:MAG: hypothetical protein WBA89_18545 [Microcoleus sp.]|uniref:hypothetical protein n=1 Tax=Microcoleus sp. TaxID=44472 RepID=UPI003C73CCD7